MRCSVDGIKKFSSSGGGREAAVSKDAQSRSNVHTAGAHTMFDLTGQAARVSWLRIAAAALALHSMSSVVHAEGSGGAEAIRFASASPTGKRVELVGHLRRPAGPGAFPAVVLLHGCGGDFGADARWGARLAEWGYVALSVDS